MQSLKWLTIISSNFTVKSNILSYKYLQRRKYGQFEKIRKQNDFGNLENMIHVEIIKNKSIASKKNKEYANMEFQVMLELKKIGWKN